MLYFYCPHNARSFAYTINATYIAFPSCSCDAESFNHLYYVKHLSCTTYSTHNLPATSSSHTQPICVSREADKRRYQYINPSFPVIDSIFFHCNFLTAANDLILLSESANCTLSSRPNRNACIHFSSSPNCTTMK